MRGFVLAAGFGTRLRPLTDHVPKALVPFAGRPLLHYALDFLKECAVSDISVNAHYLPEQMYAYQKKASVRFNIFEETPVIRGTGGALDFARPFLCVDDTFFVINADIVARFDIWKVLRGFLASDDCCRLIAWKNSTGTGTIIYDPDTCSYAGTPSADRLTDGLQTADFIGMALYRREFLEQVTSDDFSIVPVWKRCTKRGMNVTVSIVDEGYWCDTGTPFALAQAHFDVIDGKLAILPPSTLKIDAAHRGCFPAEWTNEHCEKTGIHCWIEDPAFVPVAGLSRTIVYKNACPAFPSRLDSQLLTQWGEITFNG